MWQCEADMPTVQSVNSSHTRAHTRIHTSQWISHLCMLYVVLCESGLDDADTDAHARAHTHNCMWKPAIAVALVPAEHAADQVRDALTGRELENLGTQKTFFFKGHISPSASLFVQHHLDWCWFTARSAVFACSQVFCCVYFKSLPWLWLITHASGVASALLCVHVDALAFVFR